MSKDYESLKAAAFDVPHGQTPDWLALLALADWIDEHNPDPAFAYALRWAAAWQRYPARYSSRKAAWWSSPLRGQHYPPYHHQIPWLVLNRMGTNNSGERKCRDVFQAFKRLASALADVRAVSSVTPMPNYRPK